MTTQSLALSESMECPLCLGAGELKRSEVLDRLGVKDFARVAQLSAEEAFRLLQQKHTHDHREIRLMHCYPPERVSYASVGQAAMTRTHPARSSSMRTFTQNEPLTDTELDRLGDFLKSCKGGKAMNVEQLDGFFAALIAGPEIVMPSEYYVEVFGGEMSDACEFGSLDEANEILGLMMRHGNTIAGTLNKDEVYGPILLQDENGVAHGNDWAHGFMRGTLMRHDGWLELVNDEEQGGCMVPIFMLHYEHDTDPEMRPEPISPEKREEVIVHMAAGLLGAYRYFRKHRQAEETARTSEPRRNAPKVGRNDPCPCGSGKKYKKCCGGAAVN